MKPHTADQLLLTLLLVDAVLLALLELFFVPLRVGTVSLPVSLLVAAVSTPWLVSQTARLAVKIDAPAGFAAAPLGAWLLTVVGFGMFGPGGDQVLPWWDWRGIGLVAAGVVPGALALGTALGRAKAAR